MTAPDIENAQPASSPRSSAGPKAPPGPPRNRTAPSDRPLDYEVWREVLRGEPLPAVVVDLDAFDRNVALAARLVADGGPQLALRTATKSLRVPALVRRVLAQGHPFQGLMCYDARELALWSTLGCGDLLLAYPTVQNSDLRRLRDVHETGTTVRLVVDSLSAAEAASRVLADSTRPLDLVLDVDMSWRPLGGRVHLGVRRSPLRSTADVLALWRRIERLPGVRVAGLLAYEAQVAGLGDRNPFKPLLNPAFAAVRRLSVRAVARLRHELAEALVAAGLPLEIFNGGGTGSLNFANREPWLTELTAGSGFLCSHLFDYYSNVRFEAAAFFALQVTRSSDPSFVTCAGGGYIASGEPGWDRVPVPAWPRGLKLVAAEGCGEVQTPLAVPRSVRLAPGDPVLFRHAKAGELAERFREYLLVSGGKIVDRVPTYRGLGRCFI